MTEKQLTFSDLENWLFQTKKELMNDKDVDFDLGNVTVEVNKIRYTKKNIHSKMGGKRVFIVKVNDKNYKTLVW